MNRHTRVCVLLVVSLAATAYGQFWDRLTNPQVNVTLTHAPRIPMKVSRYAFASPSRPTDCAQALIDAANADFVNSGAEVLERQRLTDIVAEHNFNQSEYTDPAARAQMGKLLGAAAVVIINVERCKPELQPLRNTWSDKRGYHVTYISKTTVRMKGSVRAVDLTTNKTFAAQPFEATETRQNTSEEGQPEYPSADELSDIVQKNVVDQIHKLFFPWTEQRKLYFFDDDPCGLKTAFKLLQAGDNEGALKQSEANAATCTAAPGVKPKVLWHAEYNVGMANFIAGNYDAAIEHLTKASTGGGGDIVTESIAECRRAKQLAADMQRAEERPILDTQPQPAAAPAAAFAGASTPAAATQKTSSTSKTKPAAQTKSGTSELEKKLAELRSLLDRGIITKPEYDEKRAEVLRKY